MFPSAFFPSAFFPGSYFPGTGSLTTIAPSTLGVRDGSLFTVVGATRSDT